MADNHSECDMRVYRVDQQTNSEFLDIDVGGLDRFGRMAGTLHSNSPCLLVHAFAGSDVPRIASHANQFSIIGYCLFFNMSNVIRSYTCGRFSNANT